MMKTAATFIADLVGAVAILVLPFATLWIIAGSGL
jgi:hypothetical protein